MGLQEVLGVRVGEVASFHTLGEHTESNYKECRVTCIRGDWSTRYKRFSFKDIVYRFTWYRFSFLGYRFISFRYSVYRDF